MISRIDKRKQRLLKRTNVSKVYKSMSIQTNNIILNNKEIQTENEEEKKEMINKSIQTEKIQTENNKSIQCKIIEKKITEKSNKINIDHYFIDFFKKIDRNNKDLKKVCYINLGLETEFKRFMLGIFDTKDDIYSIKFKGTFMGDINIKVYTSNKELFQISYDYRHPQYKDNLFSVISKIDKNMLFKKRFKYELKQPYEIKLEGYNNNYDIYFNNKKLTTIKLNDDVMFFISNSNFKIIYT